MRRSMCRAVLWFVVMVLLPVSVARAQWSHDARTPVRLLPSLSSSQAAGAILPDGSGGAFVFFQDNRFDTEDVYAMHLLYTGIEDSTWPAGGRVLCDANGNQSGIHAVSDGAGGAYVSWLDDRNIVPKNYATRMLPTGAIAPGFAANGVLLDSTRPNAQHAAEIVFVGDEGMAAVWEYENSPTEQHINGAGLNSDGSIRWAIPLETSGFPDAHPTLFTDGPGEFVVLWNYGPNSCKVHRHIANNGGWFTGGDVVSNTALQTVRPLAVPDGWGGTILTYVGTSGANSAVVAVRYFGGVLTPLGTVAAYSPNPVSIHDLEALPNRTANLLWSDNFVLMQTRIDADAGTMLSSTAFSLMDPSRPAFTVAAAGGNAINVFSQPVGSHVWAATEGTAGFGALSVVPGTFVAARSANSMRLSAVCTDGNAGVIVIAEDAASAPRHMYAMRVDRWGSYDGAAKIVSVRDVANDQGGHVRLTWNASYLDDPVLYGPASPYRIWRQVPVAAAQAALRSGRARLADDVPADVAQDPLNVFTSAATLEPGAIRIDQQGDVVYAWEYVASQIAVGFPQYSMTLATVSDSAAAGPANTLYMVETVFSSTGYTYASLPDSGHSVDNVAPAAPAAFVASLMPAWESTQLKWNANSEADLVGYELYRGATAGFVPGPSNHVATVTRTDYIDTSMGQYYKLAAVDAHGNRSAFAVVTPSSTLDTPGDLVPRVLALALESANPAISGALLRYELPMAGSVSLRLYDVNGRVVRELLAGAVGAGRHTLRWDGRDASGAEAASGMYFARLTLGGQTRVQRLVLSH